MSVLKRLKDFLTGEEDGKKDKTNETQNPENSETTEESPIKAETELETTPTVEKEVKEEPVVEETPAVEEVKAEAVEETKTEEIRTEAPVEEETEVAEEESEPEIVEEVQKEEPKTKGSVNMSLLNKDENLIEAEQVDPTFKEDIIDAGAETITLCYQCGTCTGSCPSGKRTPYRIRSIIRKSLMGLKSEVMEDETIWECVTCYACQERCPRGVAIVDVVKIIRNMQSQAGKMAQAHKMTGSFVLKTGHGVPINDATMALRKRVGLNELPPTTHEYPEALEEVRTILKKTGFDTLIGYNWETGEVE
ncbi:CoB--CoM heterodisulfide reductase subunit C [Methanobacterium sp. ACI-7]|uniref:CoB--CoM heterodisulfide reductase subunit C n=1 Tax=unclassified Methanobacterium TaxID=2627676 RepID=UPI0039C3EA44